MKFSGQILKMLTHNEQPIQYYMNLSNDLLHMNNLIGNEISMKHIGFQCVSCTCDTPLYRMGFCKKCFFKSPLAGEFILKPELSKAHLDEEDRNLEFEKRVQLQTHVVYIAYTGDIKVGVTRKSQIPYRWIDQGASEALPIAFTENRYQAGVIEVELKKHLPDKTYWKKMLLTPSESKVDLIDWRERIEKLMPEAYRQYYNEKENISRFSFPYNPPQRIESFTMDKEPLFSGILEGIKGQYLHFSGDRCINIRSHEGYVIEISIH